jgi:hypothetical protein
VARGDVKAVNGRHAFDHRFSTGRVTEPPAVVLEENPQHLWDGEDNLAVRDIEEKLLPHFRPLSAGFNSI